MRIKKKLNETDEFEETDAKQKIKASIVQITNSVKANKKLLVFIGEVFIC